MTDDPLDEKLAAELDRRAASANLSRDWSRRVLLPAVMSGMDSRTQPVMTSPWSAFAGLTAVVAILLVMVVALPRIVPGPPPTSVALASMPGAQPSPIAVPGIRVWSTKEFASAFSAGELRSSTVLVDGAISPMGDRSRGPCLPPYERCYIGRLAGTGPLVADPTVDVYGDWVRSPEGEGTQIAGAPNRWDWWTLPTAVEGEALLVQVGDGVVTLLGSVDLVASPVALTVEAARTLDASSQASYEAFIVDGWLNESEPSGTELDIDCRPLPSASQIDGLPSRYCQATDNLTNSHMDPINGLPDGSVSLVVQIGAADRFGRGELSSHGLFAISPRLYAGCVVSPCWQWDVIGRLSESPVAPEPSPEPGTQLACGPTQPPDVYASLPSASWTGVTLDDQTGIVINCEAWAVEAQDSAPMSVANYNDHLDIVEITWAETCAAYPSFSFDETLTGFELVAMNPMPANVICDGMVLAHGLRLYLDQSVAADTVITRVTRAPALTPSPPRTDPEVAIQCEQPPAGPSPTPSSAYRMKVVDSTGLVVSCRDMRPPADLPGLSGIAVQNGPSGQSELQLTWVSDSCVASSEIRFYPDEGRYEIQPVDSHAEPPTFCAGTGWTRSVSINLSQDVSADFVVPTWFGNPDRSTPRPPNVTCAGDVDLIDPTELVESCSAQDVSADPEDVGVVTSRVTIGVVWERSSCATRTSAELAIVGAGYALTMVDAHIPGCEGVHGFHLLKLQVRRPVSADQLTATVNGLRLARRVPGAEPAWWELAPTERPTASSTRLNLLVYERGCAGGDSPEGRLVGPDIVYGDLAVTITFQVRPLEGAHECPSAPGAHVTVELSEPLGDRRLVDGGFASTDRVIEHGGGLLWVAPMSSLQVASARHAALLGSDSCPETLSHPLLVDESELEQLANDLGQPNGMLGDGLAWVGSLDLAVRELGGFELYQDMNRAFYLIAFAEGQDWLADGVEPGDLVMADITSLPISGGRTIWIVGRYHQSFGSSDCQWDSDATPAAGPRADEQTFDFTLSISAPSASWTTGQSLEGLGATLGYSGAQDPFVVGGSGGGLAFAYWTRLDGDSATPTLAMTDDCRGYEFASGERKAVQMWPISGFSVGGTLTLPAGIWRLTAFADFVMGAGCSGQSVDISASIIVRVR